MATPIQYAQKPDENTLHEWRRRAMRSEDAFVGLLNDGSAEAKAERLGRVQQTVEKVRKGATVATATRGFEDGLAAPAPANSRIQLERPPTREFHKIARDHGRRTSFREGPAVSLYKGGAFGNATAGTLAAVEASRSDAAESPTRAARSKRTVAESTPLFPVELEDSLAAHLASQDIRKKPLNTGNAFGMLQTGPALDLALQNSARAAAARKKADDSRATSAIDALMEQSGWSKEWNELLNSSQRMREMDEALRTSLLEMMGSGSRVAPTAGGGWGLPSVDAYKLRPVMTPEGGHRSSDWALHGRRSPAGKRSTSGKRSPTKWKSPLMKFHRE